MLYHIKYSSVPAILIIVFLYLFIYVLTGFHYVAQAPGLKQSASLGYPKCWITGVSHCTWPIEIYLYNILVVKLEFLHLHLTDAIQIGYQNIEMYCVASKTNSRRIEEWVG